MATQSASIKKPETGPQADSGFLRPDIPSPVWMAPPAVQSSKSFEFFDIKKPHFYVIHGVPMAFVG